MVVNNGRFVEKYDIIMINLRELKTKNIRRSGKMNLSKKIKQKKENKRISNYSYIYLLTVIFILAILSITTVNAQEDMEKSIRIINPRPDFALSLRLDKGTGATYNPGERIRISFRSTKKAYVSIFGYDSFGNIKLLFPNQYQTNQLVEANKEYQIDGVIDSDSRPGMEYVQGFATTESVIISRELERIIERQLFPKMEEGILRFTLRLKGILTNLPAQRWVSSDTLHYQVVESRVGTGSLRLTSSPSGAEVYLNDRQAGRTPLNMDSIRTGDYLARVELPGYQTWTRTIQINSNQTTSVHANLVSMQRYGSIAIRSNEGNARIYLDDEYKGLTEKNRNVLLEQVREGFHDIRITLSGYHDWLRTIEVRPNQQIPLTVNLEKITRTGNLEINCDVDNAMIYLDGRYQRNTTINRGVIISNLQEGNYELRITKDGYYDYITTIKITADRANRININMQRVQREGSISVSCNESNAKIFINGTYMTTSSALQPKVFDGLKEGAYEVTIIKDGYRTWIDEVWVYSGETITVHANLVQIRN